MAFKGNKVMMRWKLKTVSMSLDAWNAHVQQELKNCLAYETAKCITSA